MTFKELVRELVKREGKKHGVNIADMSEIVRCLGEIMCASGSYCHDIWMILHHEGADRIEMKPRRAKKVERGK